MSISLQNTFLSETSVISHYAMEGCVKSAGTENPVELSSIDIDAIRETIGEKITNGNFGSIYQVLVDEGVAPRIYKIIPLDQFKDGNEIRISKIAADIGAAPTFYGACLVHQKSRDYVLIEMDDAGKSLGKWMEHLAEEVEPENALTEEERAHQERLDAIRRKMEALYGNVITATEITKKKLSREEAVAKLYENREVFYCELFSKIKLLAENHIAYTDTHVGNIMPNCGTETGLQLIDFDGAKITTDIKSAALTSIRSNYTRILYNEFKQLSDPSENSKELLRWFTNQLGFFG